MNVFQWILAAFGENLTVFAFLTVKLYSLHYVATNNDVNSFCILNIKYIFDPLTLIKTVVVLTDRQAKGSFSFAFSSNKRIKFELKSKDILFDECPKNECKLLLSR